MCREIVPTYHYFNPRSPRGERLAQQQCCCETNRFQSTLPVGGATEVMNLMKPLLLISIHAPREGSDCHDPGKEDSQEISIHAPRGGERHLAILHYWLLMDISIHAPRGGSDLPSFIFWTLLFQSTLPVGGATSRFSYSFSWLEFQSTLPVGGATGHGGYFPHRDKNFNPRSPRGERL